MDNTEGQQQQQQITFEEFLKVQLKVGRVVQAENIPGMKKILKVKVDLGLEEREIVVGAALYYKPEELIGQVLIVCTNLEPRKIGNVISNGMLLAADGQNGKPLFLTVIGDILPGASIH
jgi:methionine--tRNA ligase beta chain